jgi:hypothetical protein
MKPKIITNNVLRTAESDCKAGEIRLDAARVALATARAKAQQLVAGAEQVVAITQNKLASDSDSYKTLLKQHSHRR